MEKAMHKAGPKRHRSLPDFILLFNQIGHYLKDPQSCTPLDHQIALDAFAIITSTIYSAAGTGRCNMDPPTIKPVR